MNAFGIEIFGLNGQQKGKIERFLQKTGRERQRYDAGRLYYLSRVLEAFGNDEERAAALWNETNEKALDAASRVYDEMLSHIPKPIKENFFSCFKTLDEANVYWDTIEMKGESVVEKVWQENFWDVVDRYWEYQERIGCSTTH